MAKKRTQAQSAIEEFEGAIAAPSDNSLKALAAAANEAANTMREILALEDHIDALKAAHKRMVEIAIPDLMSAAGGTEHWKGEDGTEIKIKEYLNGSLPADEKKRAKGIALLRKYGAEDIVRTQFVVTVENKKAFAAIQRKMATIKGASVEQKEGVHPQTLGAFARERLRSGAKIDLDALGLHAGRKAELIVPDIEAAKKKKKTDKGDKAPKPKRNTGTDKVKPGPRVEAKDDWGNRPEPGAGL